MCSLTPKVSLLLSHLLLIASLDEEYMSLLLSSNIITDKMCLNLRLQDTIALKLTLHVILGHLTM